MPDQRPYATLLAKGEERRQRILDVAQRLLTRKGWRSITLAEIAKEAGVSPAGLLHHFDSKERLLHAVLDARDAYDAAHVDLSGDLIEQFLRSAERYEQMPDLAGIFLVLLIENLDPEAPLHDRLLDRQRTTLDVVAQFLRRGQDDGRYRTDVDAVAKAVEIMAFVNGMETLWLLDPSIPLVEVYREYARSLTRQLVASSSTSSGPSSS